jgi:hypothetical protein
MSPREEPTLRTPAFTRALARTATVVLVLGGLAVTGTASASATEFTAQTGCSTPPCGALNNKTSSRIGVKWTDNDKDWQYGIVEPHTTMGGYFNDGIDVDFWFIPGGCTDTRNSPRKSWSGEQWAKISSSETIVVNSRSC